jgi:AraC-like DNA-binding protein
VRTADASPVVHLPDTATTLVFRVAGDGRADLLVLGPRTRASYLRAKDLRFWVRLRIRPGRARLLCGVPVDELVDRAVPLDDLWDAAPGERLAGELLALGPRPGAVAERLRAELARRAAARTRADHARADLLDAAVAALSAGPGSPRLPAVAAELGVSERHLRALFTGGAGLSPRRFTRVDRVRRVLAGAGQHRWARLAHDSGYYDQAHMITDFRALMSVSPGAWLAGRLPPPQSCQ